MNKTDTAQRKRVHVAVGVIYNADGKILVAQRSVQQHLGGLWEFPGGKVESGESVNAALTRELHEELGIHVQAQSPLCKICHDYGDKSVLLDVWNVESFEGNPHGREGQPLRWLARQQLKPDEFPEANRAIIRALQLSDYLALVPAQSDLSVIENFSQQLPDRCLVRLRQNTQSPDSERLPRLLNALEASGHGVIVDLASASDESWRMLTGVSGVHANRHILQQMTQRPAPEHLLFGASCHNADELAKAAACGADYVLLSPVQHSLSHPDQAGLGWEEFERLTRSAGVAVYAMGGMQLSDLKKARACGARGIAGIRLFCQRPD